jgi:hypothetical protein
MTLAASPHSAELAKVPGQPRAHTAFTATARRTILEAIKKGRYPSRAADRAGVHYSTLKTWLEKGYDYQAMRLEGVPLDKEQRTFADFYVNFQRAEAGYEERIQDKVETIGDNEGQWAAFMTILERRFPDRWKKREQTEVIGVGGGADVKIHIDNSPDALREVIAVLSESGALDRLLQGIGLAAPGLGPVLDAEAHEIHHEPAEEGPE